MPTDKQTDPNAAADPAVVPVEKWEFTEEMYKQLVHEIQRQHHVIQKLLTDLRARLLIE